MGIFKKVDEAMKVEQAKTIAELKATPIHKHLGSLIVVGLIGLGVVSCNTEPSPETIIERAYFSACRAHGEGVALTNRTKDNSHKLEGLKRYDEYLRLEQENPWLDVKMCADSFARGMAVGHLKADKMEAGQ